LEFSYGVFIMFLIKEGLMLLLGIETLFSVKSCASWSDLCTAE